jgi:hypothetical protein
MKGNDLETEPETTRPADARPGRGRAVALGTAAAAVLVAAVMLLTPLAAAAGTGASTTLTAPYTGTSSAAVFWSSSGSGGKLTISALPNFNASNGAFTGGLSVAAKHSGKATSSLFAEETGQLETTSYTVTTNGTYTASATWDAVYSLDIKYHAGHGGTAGAYVVVGSWAELVDVTNSTVWNLGGTSTYYGSPTHGWFSNTTNVTYSGSAALVTGHDYEVIAGFYIEVNSWATSTGRATSSAAVDLYMGPNAAVLASITVP